jgi:hypothetical protein
MVCNFLLKQDTWTHYLYKVVFEGGFYYTGVRKKTTDNPLADGYFGSPVTHKCKWEEQTPEKTILALLWCDEGEQYDLESKHQTLCYDLNDPFCLNEHFGGGFSLETCRKAGRIGAKSQVEGKIGIHGLTPEERSIAAKETWDRLPEETQERIRDAARSAWENLPEDRKEKIKSEAKERVTREWSDRTAEERAVYMATCVEAAKEKNTCEWEVLSPSGILFDVSNMSEFCREMGLTVSLMNKVSKGERSHHKGFVVRKVTGND